MTHQGKQFKKAVANDPRDVTTIAKKMDYTREQVYRFYTIPKFSDKQLKAIARAGFDVSKIVGENTSEIIVSDKNSTSVIARLVKRIDALEQEEERNKNDLRELNAKINKIMNAFSPDKKGRKMVSH